jgi:hypothetical protein
MCHGFVQVVCKRQKMFSFRKVVGQILDKPVAGANIAAEGMA